MAGEPEETTATLEAPPPPVQELPAESDDSLAPQIEVRYRQPSLNTIIDWFSVNERLVDYYLGIADEKIQRACRAAEIACILALLKEMLGSPSLTQRSKALKLIRTFYPALRLQPEDKKTAPTKDLLKDAEQFGLNEEHIAAILAGGSHK